MGTPPLNAAGQAATMGKDGNWVWNTADTTAWQAANPAPANAWDNWSPEQFLAANNTNVNPWEKYGLDQNQWYGSQGQDARNATINSMHFAQGGFLPNGPAQQSQPNQPTTQAANPYAYLYDIGRAGPFQMPQSSGWTAPQLGQQYATPQAWNQAPQAQQQGMGAGPAPARQIQDRNGGYRPFGGLLGEARQYGGLLGGFK